MARWKLMASHYLYTLNGTEWEHNQTDRATGRMIRRRFPVPRYLDIRDPGDWTNKSQLGGTPVANGGQLADVDGEIIVCAPGRGMPGDIEFVGDPTPDMFPVDEEAAAISASFEEHWKYKPDGGDISYSQSMIDGFQTKMAEMEAKPASVEIAGLDSLVASMAAQTKAITDLLTTRRI